MTNFELGDEVRDVSTGKVGVLTDINSNPDYVKDEEYWAEAEMTDRIGSFIIDSLDYAQLLRKKADIPKRVVPTLIELADYVSNSLHSGFGGGLYIDETDTNEPDGELLAFGVSSTGQRFACRITVSEIEKADY